MVHVVPVTEMPPSPEPTDKVAYILDRPGNPPTIIGADMLGGRMSVNSTAHDRLATHLLNQQGPLYYEFDRPRSQAPRIIGGFVLQGLGVKPYSTADLLGVHRNVIARDRRKFRDFIGVEDDIAAMRTAFARGLFTVHTPAELDLDRLNESELKAVQRIAAGISPKNTSQLPNSDSDSSFARKLHRTQMKHISNAGIKLGARGQMSLALLTQLARQ